MILARTMYFSELRKYLGFGAQAGYKSVNESHSTVRAETVNACRH